MVVLQPFGWERMVQAIERLRLRFRTAVSALNAAGIRFLVAGDHAVEFHIARVDESAVRNSVDVEILVRAAEDEAARTSLENGGLRVDRPGARIRHAVNLLSALDEELAESEAADGFRVLSLSALVQRKLDTFRDLDRTHLRDLIEVRLVDHSWTARLPEKLSSRLQQLLDTPDG